MKNLIARSWQKILIVIGTILIILNLFVKIITKKNMIPDYIKYGRTFQSPKVIKHVSTSSVGISNSILSPQLIKYIIIFMAAILFVVFITSLGSKSSDKAKKK